ncbi:MAG: 3-hydroxybutyryl-CoA dehydrogenase [bacterium]|nr:3-hydroxybutyryl-CoA dehydrogenase [bacterium]
MPTVGVIGAGTMGTGIAQVAATCDWSVLLLDADEAAAHRAVESVSKRLDRRVEKGKLTSASRDAIIDRLHVASDASALGECALVVEAVVEDMDVKVGVFAGLGDHLRDDCLLATNTSSLSVTKLGRRLGKSARLVGMHFFNPVPLTPLVEVVSGADTSPESADAVADIARGWGKTVVRCKDTPGFIVNRVARRYYLESLRLLGEGLGGVDEIDAIMKRLGGFRMGPFELMDLVGIDVNYTVSCSVYEQMGKPARLKPHPIQQALFDGGQFGRKTGCGFYRYDHPGPVPAVTTDRASHPISPSMAEAARAFSAQGARDAGSLTEQYIFARVLVTIINEAALALDEGVANSDDIDLAMKTGTNYPKGPLEWADEIGFERCRQVLDALEAEFGDGRFAPAALLGRR